MEEELKQYYRNTLEDILSGCHSIPEKHNLIDKMTEELKRDIVKDCLRCPHCGVFYRKNSWEYVSETKEEPVCTYEDPINSGGNEYQRQMITRNYKICPVGHKIEI